MKYAPAQGRHTHNMVPAVKGLILGTPIAFVPQLAARGLVNPFNAMGDFRHPYISQFGTFRTEMVNWNYDILGKMH